MNRKGVFAEKIVGGGGGGLRLCLVVINDAALGLGASETHRRRIRFRRHRCRSQQSPQDSPTCWLSSQDGCNRSCHHATWKVRESGWRYPPTRESHCKCKGKAWERNKCMCRIKHQKGRLPDDVMTFLWGHTHPESMTQTTMSRLPVPYLAHAFGISIFSIP